MLCVNNMMSEIDNVLQDFELLTEIAYDLSQKFDGVETQDIRKKKSTYFLAKVVPGCISLLKIIPKSSFSLNKDAHLDFSSISTLSRNLIEAANLHWYYCIDHIDEEEINFRFLLYDYHDTTTLYRITENLKFSPEDIEYLGNQRSELRERLEKNSYFISLDKTEKKQIIKGRKSTLLTQV